MLGILLKENFRFKLAVLLSAMLAYVLTLQGYSPFSPHALAQELESSSDKSPVDTSPDRKVAKWAFPRFSEQEVDGFLSNLEYYAFRYRVDFNLALAVVSAEASFPGSVSRARKTNLDVLGLLSRKATYGYPSVENDLENAISSLAELLRVETSTENALKSYWASQEYDYNKDTLNAFLARVREKYSYLTKPKEKEKKDYLREVERFPEKPGEEAQITVMPNLNAQLVRYDVEDAYKEVALYFNPKLKDEEATLIARSVLSFSMKTRGVDPRLVMAVIAAESRFRPRAVSKKGAMGLGQLMPATARSHGIRDPFDPVQNIYVTVKYLEREIQRHGGKSNWIDLVLASYNAGPGAVAKYGGVPPYNETISFVRTVKKYYYQLTGSY